MSPRTLLPLLTALSLFALLGFSTVRSGNEIRTLIAERDSALTLGREAALAQDSLLGTGDALPEIELRTASAGGITLRELPARFRYLYFYRADCVACGVLEELWSAVPAVRRDSVAFIAFHPTESLAPDSLPAHFAWTPQRWSAKRWVTRVPTLLVRADSTRVLASAHGSIDRVANALALYGIMRRGDVDSAVALLKESEIAKRHARWTR